MSTFGKANKQRNNVYFEETEDFAAVTAQVLGGTKEVNAKYARHIADSCNEITTLREQVERLTKERDEWKNDAINGGNAGYLREQLAALAEQNEKMRSFFEFAWKDIPMNEYAFKILEHTMNLPNLATPILNKIKAEAYLEAAELVEAHHTWITNVAAGKLLRAKSDELEQSK